MNKYIIKMVIIFAFAGVLSFTGCTNINISGDYDIPTSGNPVDSVAYEEIPVSLTAFDRMKLYNAIISEVNATNDIIMFNSARIVADPDGNYPEMLLTVWAYDRTYNNSIDDVDNWIVGDVTIKDDGANGWSVEFVKSDERQLYSSINPLANENEMAMSLVGFTVDIEYIYNSNFIKDNIMGEPKNVLIFCNNGEYIDTEYIAQDVSNITWFDMQTATPEKIEKPEEITPESVMLENKDYFIIVPFYEKSAASQYNIAFEYEDYVSANLMAIILPRR